MEVAIIFFALFFSVFGIFYFYYQSKTRERLAIIDKGLDPGLFRLPPHEKKKGNGRRSGSLLKFSLKFGMFLIGAGIGFILGSLILQNSTGLLNEVKVFLMIAMFFVFSGISLVSSFFLGRHIDIKDSKE